MTMVKTVTPMCEIASTTSERLGGSIFQPLGDKARAVVDVHLPQPP
jgi:hypothetical protein